MNAAAMVERYKESLIGKTIITQRIGDYPGGWAEVIELFPDKDGAPEIVCQVRHPTFGEIGIFDHEEVFADWFVD